MQHVFHRIFSSGTFFQSVDKKKKIVRAGRKESETRAIHRAA
jgi:hypothetical protein